MNEYFQAFLLGNAAILGNVCVLPLYPGFIAYLGGSVGKDGKASTPPWIGLVVFAGMITVMLALGWVLFTLNRSFSSIFDWFLPVIFGIVIVLGIAMMLGRNPFARLATAQLPLGNGRFTTAFLYGMLLGPMTLPCTGPLIVATFVLGVGDTASLLDGIVYFIAFGFGFGWPLVALPLLASPIQHHLTRWVAHHYAVIGRVSGMLLVVIALFGFWNDVVPALNL